MMVVKYTVLIVIFLALYQKVWTLLKLLASVRSDEQLTALKTTGVVSVTGSERARLVGITS